MPAAQIKTECSTDETDDSHSYHDWNDDPPRDPEMYGITIYEH